MRALPADKHQPPVTLTDPDMMSQDISKPLGQWFASRLSAREDVRRVFPNRKDDQLNGNNYDFSSRKKQA
jgi:hypothetical protein